MLLRIKWLSFEVEVRVLILILKVRDLLLLIKSVLWDYFGAIRGGCKDRIQWVLSIYHPIHAIIMHVSVIIITIIIISNFIISKLIPLYLQLIPIPIHLIPIPLRCQPLSLKIIIRTWYPLRWPHYRTIIIIIRTLSKQWL